MKLILIFAMVGMLGMFTACDDDDDDTTAGNPFADFEYAVSEENPLEVAFTNKSTNSENYLWDFGDGETSTEENPVHEYAESGTYEVVLTATNADDVSTDVKKTLSIGSNLLADDDSKTWKLYREETSMGVGPNAEEARSYWSLENDGSRPCVYKHEFTFHIDGTFEFNDNGVFWGEEAVFEGTDVVGTCFEPNADNMINSEGDDVSAWLSGTHEYDYDADAGQITLNGEGAWMGMPQLGTSGESIVPEESTTFNVSIEEHEGYDLMIISYEYEELYWDFTYVSYSDPSLEPELVEDAEEFGEDLEDITPDEIFLTFASRDEGDMATIDTIDSGSSVVFGVEDPTDATATVGEFIRTEGVQYQELQFQVTPEPKDIQFDNFTTAKIDVFVPADTEFAEGGLQKHMVFGFADLSQTEEWWNSPEQYVVEGDDLVVGEWTTYTFDLTATEVLNRDDLDMLYLGLGGGGHDVGATFYVRNLTFE
ncbi:MAG: PKD domain-containing protein [Bacteroidota bacterium]